MFQAMFVVEIALEGWKFAHQANLAGFWIKGSLLVRRGLSQRPDIEMLMTTMLNSALYQRSKERRSARKKR